MRLVWKGRIAPQARFVGAFDAIESAWPLHGSVLIENGFAYVVAGRSSYLDGGIFACALDPKTGKVAKEANIYSPDPETGRQPYDSGQTWSIPGATTDILTSDGGSVYMGHRELFEESDGDGKPVFAGGGMLDASWFSRINWSANDTDAGELAVFDGMQTYGIEAYVGSGKGTGKGDFFRPAGKRGYRMFRSRKKGGEVWSRRIPVRGKAMVLAGDRLVVAGPPDVAPPGIHLQPSKAAKAAGCGSYPPPTVSRCRSLHWIPRPCGRDSPQPRTAYTLRTRKGISSVLPQSEINYNSKP